MNNKVKLFSHTDLDGRGCNVVAKYTIGKVINLECENLNYDNVNERIKEFFNSKELEEYNIVYVTDISVNNEVAELIESKINKIGIKVRLLDHHPTARELNKYNWCTVDIKRDGEKTSGTRMLYDELLWCIDSLNKKGLINKKRLFDFVESVRNTILGFGKKNIMILHPRN